MSLWPRKKILSVDYRIMPPVEMLECGHTYQRKHAKVNKAKTRACRKCYEEQIGKVVDVLSSEAPQPTAAELGQKVCDDNLATIAAIAGHISPDSEQWDSLSYGQKNAAMQAFFRRVGYDPEAHRAEDRLRRMEDRIKSLEGEVSTLTRKLQQFIESEEDARRIRIQESAQQYRTYQR